MRTPPRICRAALLLLLTFAATLAHAQPVDFATGQPNITWSQVDPAEHTFDHWYLDTINGQPSGYWRSAMVIEDNQIITLYEEHSVESHGGERMVSTNTTVWTETLDFKPVSIVTVTSSGSDAVTKTYRFLEDGIELTSEQNGRSIKRKLPAVQGDYLTGAQASIATDMYLKRGDRHFTLDILDITVGLTPYKMTYQRSGEGTTPWVPNPAEPFELADGSEAQATHWTSAFSIFPNFEMEHWINEGRVLVGLAYEVDGMQFKSQLADKTVTEVDFDPPEMAGLSVVVPDKPIKQVNRQKKIVYELHYDAGDSDIVPATTAKQSVESLGKGKARVTVDLETPSKTVAADEKYLANSIMIDHEDELVRKLADRAIQRVNDKTDHAKVAMAFKRFVTGHITGLSLSVGDGSASEAARTREGDCTECSVLLAAMLRAHGIPSRCVVGLAYAEEGFVGQENVFVYHQWTQAWIEVEDGKGYWLDVDSAMWRYTAGHIALGTSAMGDEDQQDLFDIVPMQQDLEIKVIETAR